MRLRFDYEIACKSSTETFFWDFLHVSGTGWATHLNEHYITSKLILYKTKDIIMNETIKCTFELIFNIKPEHTNGKLQNTIFKALRPLIAYFRKKKHNYYDETIYTFDKGCYNNHYHV